MLALLGQRMPVQQLLALPVLLQLGLFSDRLKNLVAAETRLGRLAFVPELAMEHRLTELALVLLMPERPMELVRSSFERYVELVVVLAMAQMRSQLYEQHAQMTIALKQDVLRLSEHSPNQCGRDRR